jgi:hypothetical protein
MALTFRYKKRADGSYFPHVPLTLHGEITVDIVAFVDSGADVSIMPKSLADAIGVKRHEKSEVVGLGGKKEGVHASLNCSLATGHEPYRFRISVVIIDDEELAKDVPLVLGREGFFEHFEITFREKEKRLILKKVD